jgi:hypothetical protein
MGNAYEMGEYALLLPAFTYALNACFSRYRNKVEFSFSTQEWAPADGCYDDPNVLRSSWVLGFNRPGYFDEVLHIEGCALQGILRRLGHTGLAAASPTRQIRDSSCLVRVSHPLRPPFPPPPSLTRSIGGILRIVSAKGEAANRCGDGSRR